MKKKLFTLVLVLGLTLTLGLPLTACGPHLPPPNPGPSFNFDLGEFVEEIDITYANNLLDNWHDMISQPDDLFELGAFNIDSSMNMNMDFIGGTDTTLNFAAQFDGEDLSLVQNTLMIMNLDVAGMQMSTESSVLAGTYRYNGVWYGNTGTDITMTMMGETLTDVSTENMIRIGNSIVPSWQNFEAYILLWELVNVLTPLNPHSNEFIDIINNYAPFDWDDSFMAVQESEFVWARSYENGYTVRVNFEGGFELEGNDTGGTGHYIFVFDNDGRLVEYILTATMSMTMPEIPGMPGMDGRINISASMRTIIDYEAPTIDWTEFYRLRNEHIETHF